MFSSKRGQDWSDDEDTQVLMGMPDRDGALAKHLRRSLGEVKARRLALGGSLSGTGQPLGLNPAPSTRRGRGNRRSKSTSDEGELAFSATAEPQRKKKRRGKSNKPEDDPLGIDSTLSQTPTRAGPKGLRESDVDPTVFTINHGKAWTSAEDELFGGPLSNLQIAIQTGRKLSAVKSRRRYLANRESILERKRLQRNEERGGLPFLRETDIDPEEFTRNHGKPWTEAENELLRTSPLSHLELARQLGRKPKTIRTRRSVLNNPENRKEIIRRSDAKYRAKLRIPSVLSLRRPWTPKEEAAITAADRPTDKVLAEKLNRTVASIKRHRSDMRDQGRL